MCVACVQIPCPLPLGPCRMNTALILVSVIDLYTDDDQDVSVYIDAGSRQVRSWTSHRNLASGLHMCRHLFGYRPNSSLSIPPFGPNNLELIMMQEIV
jgi:hypothetical protein